MQIADFADIISGNFNSTDRTTSGSPLTLMKYLDEFLLPVFLLIAVLTPGGLVQAQDPISHGQSLVAEFCARCHAVGVKGESPYPLAPPFRTLGRIVDLDELPRALSE